MLDAINPDIAIQVQTVGVVKATLTIVSHGVATYFAVIERVTYPHWIIENVSTNSTYVGAASLEDALQIIKDSHREMP